MTAPDVGTARKTVLALGLPGSGKTTFLAAFWHVVEQGTLGSALVVDRLDGDRSYLNRIAGDWADGRPLERTHMTGGATVGMALRDVRRGARFTVVFPDVAGELFREAWVERGWPRGVAEAAADAGGLLLFVHPEVAEPVRLDTWHRAAVAAGAPEAPVVPGTPSGVGEEPDEAPWDPRRSPHAVVLVDLLQAALAAQGRSQAARRRVRVAVVVSAWDLVDGAARVGAARGAPLEGAPRPAAVDPRRWVAERLALLAQFLRTNGDALEARVYGLSAQGGDLDADAARLLEAPTPESRIRVVEAGGVEARAPVPPRVHHDLTAIMDWVGGADGAEGS